MNAVTGMMSEGVQTLNMVPVTVSMQSCGRKLIQDAPMSCYCHLMMSAIATMTTQLACASVSVIGACVWIHGTSCGRLCPCCLASLGCRNMTTTRVYQHTGMLNYGVTKPLLFGDCDNSMCEKDRGCPQAWDAGDMSPPGQPRRSDSRASRLNVFTHFLLSCILVKSATLGAFHRTGSMDVFG
jgi:hypothetical protein